jgi:hypothetical protein
MSPKIKSEMAVSWHEEAVADGDMTAKSVPITFSAPGHSGEIRSTGRRGATTTTR